LGCRIRGKSIVAGKHAVAGGTERPRGPSLIYFRDSELAAAYIYLAAHPPEN